MKKLFLDYNDFKAFITSDTPDEILIMIEVPYMRNEIDYGIGQEEYLDFRTRIRNSGEYRKARSLSKAVVYNIVYTE